MSPSKHLTSNGYFILINLETKRLKYRELTAKDGGKKLGINRLKPSSTLFNKHNCASKGNTTSSLSLNNHTSTHSSIPMAIPVIDFSKLNGEERSKAMVQIANGCEEWGFFQVLNILSSGNSRANNMQNGY